MYERFAIIDQGVRPEAEHVIFCDGAGGSQFRADTDLDLSHWKPNRTPSELLSGTSTEICFRYLDNPRNWDPDSVVVANNHLDVDGLLSLYVLVHSRHALRHRQTIVQAAEMGDFWGWGEPLSQRLYQALTWMMQLAPDSHGSAARSTYEAAFERIPGLIDGSDPETVDVDHSLYPLSRSVQLVEAGAIVRREVGPHLTGYVIPNDLAESDESAIQYVPDFNEAISPQALLWPHARAKWDRQRVCVVSCEQSSGWRHDIFAPGYLWAETSGLWRIPGLDYHPGMQGYEFKHPRFDEALTALETQEEGDAFWIHGGQVHPLAEKLQEQFPLLARVLNRRGQPGVSELSADQVLEVLAPVFE